MPGGIIFFSLTQLGAQLSLLSLSTGTLCFSPHRNFYKSFPQLFLLCALLTLSTYAHVSVIDCPGVNVLRHKCKKNLHQIEKKNMLGEPACSAQTFEIVSSLEEKFIFMFSIGCSTAQKNLSFLSDRNL